VRYYSGRLSWLLISFWSYVKHYRIVLNPLAYRHNSSNGGGGSSSSLQLSPPQWAAACDGRRGTEWPASDATWPPEMICEFPGPDSYAMLFLCFIPRALRYSYYPNEANRSSQYDISVRCIEDRPTSHLEKKIKNYKICCRKMCTNWKCTKTVFRPGPW